MNLAFTPPADAPRWQRWCLWSAPARTAIFLATAALLGVGAFALAKLAGWDGASAPATARALMRLLLGTAPAVLAYVLLVRAVERRPVAELAPRRIARDGPLGLLGGVALFSVVVGVLWLLGSYRVSGYNPQAEWLASLLMVGLAAGIAEEILLRGVLFRIVEESLGTWWALGISALAFGGLHLGNPHATAWSALAIAIEAGVLFGLLYHVTRSLPACMGVHAGWNFAQGTIYGIPVSGTRADGWLVSVRSGPDWLSGGAFGAEASVAAIGVCLTVSFALLWVARQRRSLVPPAWRRR